MRARSRFPSAMPAALACAALVLGAALLGAAGPGAAQPQAAQRGIRTLILVRHGVYDETDTRDDELGKALLPKGREQARLTGARLAAWPGGIDALHASTMTRARQTAEIIAALLPGRAVLFDRNLRECEPPGYRVRVMAGFSLGDSAACAVRLDGLFERYFTPSPERDSTEVLVCHGNVIRWLTLRALGADPKLWTGMSLANCSLTVIEVRPDGRCRITAVGDRGHLPQALQTWAMPRPAAADSTRRR